MSSTGSAHASNPGDHTSLGQGTAVTLLGASSNRLRLLRLVLAHEELTALEMMDALGLTRNGVGKHLAALTDAGFLIERRATHPRGAGDVIYWRADRDKIAEALWAHTGDLFGYGQSNSRG